MGSDYELFVIRPKALEVEHSNMFILETRRTVRIHLRSTTSTKPNGRKGVNTMLENLSNENNSEAKPLTFVKMTVDENAPSQVRMRDVGDLGIAQGN